MSNISKEKGKILLSITMTCFNQSSFIEEAIESVIKQTYKNWQIVIVDDCSADNSVKVIKSYIKKFNIIDKVKILTNKKNMGYGYSLKKAISNCDGELIGILDGDDALDEDIALKMCIKKHIKHPEVSMTYTNFRQYNKNFNRLQKVWKSSQIPEGKSFINKGGDIKVSHFKVFKKQFYDLTLGVDETLLQIVDKDLILKLEEVGKLLYIDGFFYKYRSHPQNLSMSKYKKSKEYRNMISKSRQKIYKDALERRDK